MTNTLLDIAIGHSATSKTWKNTQITWEELLQKFENVKVTSETYKQYLQASKEDQFKIKDIGGYLGGYLRGGKRGRLNVVHRQLICLDIDFAYNGLWEDFILLFENAAALHSTHKHTESKPRYRLIVPLNREVLPDEYEAIARKIAGLVGIEYFDSTSFEINRLMFWPSVSADAEYVFKYQDGPRLDADSILNMYVDWKDSSAWPTANAPEDQIKRQVKEQQDPLEKKGIVGYFCKTYSIKDCIDTYLKDAYVHTTDPDRYTYTKGSTHSGLVVYDDKFAFSHHSTDPGNGKLLNAFDFVRVHTFSHLDNGNSLNGSKSKSFRAMEDLALNDKNVKALIAKENLQRATEDFKTELDFESSELDWMQDLEVNAKGLYLSSATNISTILSNDPNLKETFRLNDFDRKRYVFKDLPWRDVKKPEPIKNVDYSGIRNYFEVVYGISSSNKIEDSLVLEFEANHFHPITDYLNELKWDGKKRVEDLLIDYLGADNNIYTREAIKTSLVGAIARVFQPGIKFDQVLTLVGNQGTGKSTFVRKLGVNWYSDSFSTVHGKEAFEQLQGAWFIEIAELSGLRKAEIEAVKHFITKQDDTFRAAYARVPETYLRQCIFIATTNDKDFLRDPSGNRRFLPVAINLKKAKKNVFEDLEAEIPQIWAEAMTHYKKGKNLYLRAKADKIAKIEQRKHSEVDERKGLIEAYLNMPLPEEWETMDTDQRKFYIEDIDNYAKGYKERQFVCISEIWCECLGLNKKDMDRYKTRAINDILRSLEGWEQSNSTKIFKIYGKQKYYFRDTV